MAFDPTLAYRLHANVALRPEPFGALAYHYGNRKLVFLKSPRMVTLVRSLGEFGSVDAALVPLDLSTRARANYLSALLSLERSEMIVVQNSSPEPHTPEPQSQAPQSQAPQSPTPQENVDAPTR